MTTQTQQQDEHRDIQDDDQPSTSIEGVPRGRAGCPIWCVDHLDEKGDDHAGRPWHLELSAWTFTATPHAWEDGGFAQHSPLHVVIEGRNYEYEARPSMDLTIPELDQLINLLRHARSHAVSDADLCSVGKAWRPASGGWGLQVRTRDMREDVVVGEDAAGNPVLWLREHMLPARTVCELGVALEGFQPGAAEATVTRIAEDDVDTAGVVIKGSTRILVLPRGSLGTEVLEDANMLLSAADAE